MFKLVYFASIREQLGCEQEQLLASPDIHQVEDLIRLLVARGQRWREVLSDGRVLVAVNQQMSQTDAVIVDGDEIAFFPPVTGG